MFEYLYEVEAKDKNEAVLFCTEGKVEAKNDKLLVWIPNGTEQIE